MPPVHRGSAAEPVSGATTRAPNRVLANSRASASRAIGRLMTRPRMRLWSPNSPERAFSTIERMFYTGCHATGVSRRTVSDGAHPSPEHGLPLVAQPVHGLRPSVHVLLRA